MSNEGEEEKKRFLGSVGRWHDKHHGHRTNTESFFYYLFWIALFVVLVFLLCTWIFNEPPFFKRVVPIGAVNSWDEFRSFTFGIAGLIGAVFGLYQLFNSAQRTRLSDKDTKTRAKEATTKVEAERNERFIKAAELLKDDDDSVRMAGIYALERLAIETHEYLNVVVNVLSGFIRERTIRPDYSARPKSRYSPPYRSGVKKDSPEYLEELRREKANGWSRPTEPIKAAANALVRISRQIHSKKKESPIIDLRGANLPRLEGNKFQMNDWRLSDADLQGAWLQFANLKGSRLSDANLKGANIQNANLQDAKIENTNFQNSITDGINLTNCFGEPRNLEWQQLEDAVWPVDGVPGFAQAYDKTWCTDDKDPTKLHPDLLNEDGEYHGVPSGFRERREKEIAERRAADENKADQEAGSEGTTEKSSK